MSEFVGFICGPAKGTKDKPYRCICCRRSFADYNAIAVSICWSCMSDDATCRSCRARGVWVSDLRVGCWNDSITEYDPEGGMGHRLLKLSRTNGIMACGARIPRAHFGDGKAVIPECPVCWAEP